MSIRENVIEDHLVKEMKKIGGRAVKFTSSYLRSLPDRICVFPEGVVAFVEVKRPGRKPTPKQRRMIRWLNSLGHIAVWVDSRPRVDAFIQWVKENKLTL